MAVSETFAGRLQWAIDHQPRRGRERGLRLFQRRMDGTEADGTALSTIQGYLRGDTTPSLAFVAEAARVLNVRVEWLGFGSGWPTQTEQQAAGAALDALEATVRALRRPMNQLAEVIHEFETDVRDTIATAIPGFWTLPDTSRRNVLRGFERFVRLPSTLDEFGDRMPRECIRELTERFGTYLAGPFNVLRLDPESFSATDRALILEAQLHALDVARWATYPEEEPSTSED